MRTPEEIAVKVIEEYEWEDNRARTVRAMLEYAARLAQQDAQSEISALKAEVESARKSRDEFEAAAFEARKECAELKSQLQTARREGVNAGLTRAADVCTTFPFPLNLDATEWDTLMEDVAYTIRSLIEQEDEQ